jgi:hypothetical protein
MAESIRIFYSGRQGRTRMNVNWPRLSKNSAVLVTASECSFNISNHVNLEIPVPGRTPEQAMAAYHEAELKAWRKERPNLGAADVYVTNIGPHGDGREAGGVEFFLHVNWRAPLAVVVTITWLGEVDAFFVA